MSMWECWKLLISYKLLEKKNVNLIEFLEWKRTQ